MCGSPGFRDPVDALPGVGLSALDGRPSGRMDFGTASVLVHAPCRGLWIVGQAWPQLPELIADA